MKKVRLIILQNLTTNQKSLHIWNKKDFNLYPLLYSIIFEMEVPSNRFKKQIDKKSYNVIL